MAVPPPTTITGTSGDDPITGTAGNDVIDGREGNDTIDGAAGNDWVTYQDAPGPVDVFFSSNGIGGFATGAFGDDSLANIENVVGTNFADQISAPSTATAIGVDNIFNGLGGDDVLLGGKGNDTLYGGDGQDFLYGQQGNDALYGEAGNDFMRGGTGDDTLDGGSGFDRVSFFQTGGDTITNGVTVSLMLQGVAQDTGQGMDTLVGIEALSGTPFNDSLTGDNNANWLVSADFDGAGGDDQLYGLDGYDLIEVAAGNHIIDGGGDTDVLSFNALGFALPNGVTVSLLLQGAPQTTGLGNMTITNIEDLSGTGLDDVLTGNAVGNNLFGAGGSDTLNGGDGDDVLYGDGIISAYAPDGSTVGISFFEDSSLFGQTAGNDLLNGGLGDDILFGGAGIDTASYANASGSVQVTLFATNGASSGADGFDVMYDVENVIGSSFDDVLRGNALDNALSGGDGNDSLYGGAGNDNLLGGNGDDQLRGDAGDDVLNGGAGYDRVSFFSTSPVIGVNLDLNIQGVAQNTNYGMDTLIGIEHASGTVLSDTIIGNAGDNWLWNGGDGNAATIGTGNDIISAGAGNDLVEVGNGNHTLDGGTGIDTLSFLGGQTETTVDGVTFSLALQGAAQATEQGSMTATGFENVSGSIYDDILTGNGLDNILLGDWGSDALNGGDGNDTLYGDGRLHVDTHLTGGSGPITLFGDAEATFPGGLGVDGNDTLNGGKGADTLYGGQGNDILTGGANKDRFVIESHSGHDTITDFKNGDTIVFDPSSGVSGFASLTLTASGSKDTLITWGTGDSLLVKDIKPGQIHASDFQFGSPAAAASADAAFHTQDYGLAESLSHGSSFGLGHDSAMTHAGIELAALATHAG